MSNKIDIHELLKILPELIRTNDEVKGAIISALSGVVATKEDIRELIEQSNHNLSVMQKQMDERFNAMQKQMDERFNAMQKQMDERFQKVDERFNAMQKQMDDRFNAMQKQMDERFQKVDERFDRLENRMENGFNTVQNHIDEIHVDVMTLSNKEGDDLQNLILKLMKETLKLNNVDPEKIRREILVDTEGELFGKGFSTDIDVLLENGNTYLVEVKAKADSRDFYHLKRVGQLYEYERKKKVTGLVMVALRIKDKTIAHGNNTGIKIIAGTIMYS